MEKESGKNSMSPNSKPRSKKIVAILVRVGAVIGFLSSCAGIIVLGINFLQLRNELGSSKENAKKSETEISILIQQRDLLGTVAVADNNLESLQETQVALNKEMETVAPSLPTISVVSRTPTETQTPTDTPTITFTPTFTPIPTATFTPSPSMTATLSPLFEGSFDQGLPNGMRLVYGDIDFINGQLLAHNSTLLSIGDDSWKNYEVEYKTKKHTYCWGLQNNSIGAHAIDQDNMVMFSWNYCQTGWFEITNGNWKQINTSGGVPANPGSFITIRYVAQNGDFSVYINNQKFSEYFNDKYTQGKVYIQLSDQSVIDSIRVNLLP